MNTAGTTSLGTLVVYLTANASQYTRALKSVEVDTATALEQAAKSAKYASVAIAGSLALIGAASVREFAKFDEAMVHSLAILGNVSEETRAQMEDAARDIAKHSTNSADKVASAYQGLASAGLDAKQSIAALATVERFSVAGQMSMNTSVLALTDSVGALGLASQNAAEYQKNITRVADVLAKGANISQASVEELAQALQGKVAGGLRLVNKSVEEGVAVLGAFAKAGIKGMEASDKMGQVLRDLQVSALEQPAIWRQMGLAVYDTAGNMRNFADIVEGLEKALGPLSSEEKRQALTMLGFQDRSVAAMQSLLGFSGLIREYENDLRNAGGTTKDMADIQLTSLNAQFALLVNNVKDALLTIGQELLPVINMFNAYMTESGKQTNNFAEAVRTVSQIIKTGLVVSVGLVSDVVAGYSLIIKGGQIALVAATSVIFQVMKLVAQGIEKAIKLVVDGLNFIRREYAVLAMDFQNYKPLEFKGFDFVRLWEDQADGLDDVLTQLMDDFGKLVDKGRPSVKLLEDLGKAQEKVMGYSKSGTYSLEDLAAMEGKYTVETKKATAATEDFSKTFARIKFDNATRDPLFTALQEGLRDVEKAMAKGAITAKEYEAAVRDVMAKNNQFIMPVQGMMNQTGDQNVDQFIDMHNEEKLLTDSYNRKLKATEDYYKTLGTLSVSAEKERMDKLAEMAKNYNAQEDVFQQKRKELILMTAMNISDSMLSIAKDAAGEQSGIYKAMFAMSKAFAIADSIVKISQGIANAAALPFPANLGAMATVAAATANIVSSIKAVALSFEGGGYTGDGPRSGGIDGKGGFMAMLHPKERIYDEHQNGRVSDEGGGGPRITIHQTFTGGVTQSDLIHASERTKQDTIKAVADGLKRGGSYRNQFKQ